MIDARGTAASLRWAGFSPPRLDQPASVVKHAARPARAGTASGPVPIYNQRRDRAASVSMALQKILDAADHLVLIVEIEISHRHDVLGAEKEPLVEALAAAEAADAAAAG